MPYPGVHDDHTRACGKCGRRPVVAWFRVTVDGREWAPTPMCEPCADAFASQWPDCDWRTPLAEAEAGQGE